MRKEIEKTKKELKKIIDSEYQMKDFIREMKYEQRRQEDRWGEQNHDMSFYLTILVEEVGEIARAILDKKPKDMYTELVQVATVAKSMAECLQRKK